MSDLKVKKGLRAAWRADPEAFDRLVREYLEDGAEVFGAPRPGANAGAKKIIGRDNYALLYVRVLRIQNDEGISETAALKRVADSCDYWSNPDTGYVGTIESKSAAQKHFKKAKQLYEDDPDFRDRVNFLRWAWEVIT